MASDESARTTTARAALRSFRAALADVAGDPELRAYYAAFLGLFAVVELYERAVPLLAADVGISAATLGVGFGVARAAEIVVSPATGVVADARDRAAVAAVAAVALAAALALFPRVSGVTTLVPLMASVAVARLFLTNSVTPAISAALSDGREGLGWAVRDVGLYAGSALGLAAGGALVARFGVASVFPIAAPVALGVAAVVRRASDRGWPTLLPPRAWVPTLRAALRRVAAAATATSLPSPVRSTAASLPRPHLLARFCAVEAAVSLGGGMSLFLLPVLALEVGLRGETFLALFAGASVAAAPLSVVGGVAADRRSRKRLYVANYAAETLMLLAFGVAGGAAIFRVDSQVLFLAGIALFVVQTAFEPAVLAYFFDQFPDERAATAWSVEGMVSKTAGVVAPVVGGVLFDVTPGLPFLAGAGLLAVGTRVALTLPRGEIGS